MATAVVRLLAPGATRSVEGPDGTVYRVTIDGWVDVPDEMVGGLVQAGFTLVDLNPEPIGHDETYVRVNREDGSETWLRVYKATDPQPGAQGPQGNDGRDGDLGPQGEKGEQGDTGPQGPQGARGSQGAQGARGFRGDVGPRGEQGPRGLPGYGGGGGGGGSGPQGPQGVPGAQGAAGGGGGGGDGSQGPQGDVGAQGPQGAAGATGATGPQGAVGAQGNQGAQGTPGAQGTAGAQGNQGNQGTPGAQGAAGAQGNQGTAGAQGAAGAQGNQGATGSQGPQGTQGPQGAQGATGAQGPQGNQGATGSQGTQGTQGTQGLPGDETGVIASLSSGVPITTSDVTSSTTVYVMPYKGWSVTVWDGSNWVSRRFPSDTQIAHAIGTGTAGVPRDIFVYDNSGVLGAYGVDWTDASTRATAVVFSDGRKVLSGDKTKRFVCTICRFTSTTTADSGVFRGLSNEFNSHAKAATYYEANDHFVDTNYTTQMFNANASAFCQFVLADSQLVDVKVFGRFEIGSVILVAAVDGVCDAQTTPYPQLLVGGYATNNENTGGGGPILLAPGLHTVYLMEQSDNTGRFSATGGIIVTARV